MDSSESLSHSRWECKYHVVFIPKCRRKALFAELRGELGEVFRRLAEQKESRVLEGHLIVPANQVVHPSRSGKLKAPTNSFQRNSDEPPQSSKILPLQSSPICEAGPGGDERGGGGAAGRVQRTDRPQMASAVQA